MFHGNSLAVMIFFKLFLWFYFQQEWVRLLLGIIECVHLRGIGVQQNDLWAVLEVKIVLILRGLWILLSSEKDVQFKCRNDLYSQALLEVKEAILETLFILSRIFANFFGPTKQVHERVLVLGQVCVWFCWWVCFKFRVEVIFCSWLFRGLFKWLV